MYVGLVHEVLQQEVTALDQALHLVLLVHTETVTAIESETKTETNSGSETRK